MLREYQEEIERLKSILKKQNHLTTIPEGQISKDILSNNIYSHSVRDDLIEEYQTDIQKIKNFRENEKNEKKVIIQPIQTIKEEYQENTERYNREIKEKCKKELTSEEEIVNRIEALKATIIGGEKADDKELSERRRKKKLAAENRARYKYLKN